MVLTLAFKQSNKVMCSGTNPLTVKLNQ